MGEPIGIPKKKASGELPMFPPKAKPLKFSGTKALVNETTDFFIEGYFAEGKKLSVLENRYGKQFVELHEEMQELNKEARSLSYKKGNTEEAKESRAAFEERMGEITERQDELKEMQVNLETAFYTELEQEFPFLMHKKINLKGSAISKNEENGRYRILDREKSKKAMKTIVARSVNEILSFGGKVSAAKKETEKNFKRGDMDGIYLGMGGGNIDIGVAGTSENARKFNTVLINKLYENLADPLREQGVKLEAQKSFSQDTIFVSALAPATDFQT
ncbi:MAG: hypothetical protein GY852_07965 [bacterium]|nr:hypothetical protein [bacterium]